MYIGGEFESVDDVFGSFWAKPEDRAGIEIVAAEYSIHDYEGSAWVVFIQNGNWYEVHGSHCSCYGLENQWNPELTVVAAMLRYNKFSPGFKDAIIQRAAQGLGRPHTLHRGA